MAAWENLDFDFGVHKNHPTHLSHHLALVLRRDTLDQAEVVRRELVAACCPWVAELRGLLQRWEGARRGSQLSLDRVEGSRGYRKITPVAAPREKRPAEEQGALQAALEKNFFHNQPSALRRTVDFLAERLASNAIRKVREGI